MAKQLILEIDAKTEKLEAKLRTIPEAITKQAGPNEALIKLEKERLDILNQQKDLVLKVQETIDKTSKFSKGIQEGAARASLAAANAMLDKLENRLKTIQNTYLAATSLQTPKDFSTEGRKNTGGTSYLGGVNPAKIAQLEEEKVLEKKAQEALIKLKWDYKQLEIKQAADTTAQIHREEMAALKQHITARVLEEENYLKRKNAAAVKMAKEYIVPKAVDTREITAKLPDAQKIYSDLFGSAKNQLAASIADNAVKSTKIVREEVRKTNEHLHEQRNHFSGIATHIGSIIGLYRIYNALINISIAALASIPKTGILLETTKASLTASFGSLGAAAKELTFLTEESKRTGLAVNVLRENYAQASASFLAAGESAESTRKIFSNLNTVAATLHLNQDKTSSIYLALSQIFNKTKLQAEELTKQLAQTIPGVTNQQAKALSISVSDLYDKMKKGAISAHEAVFALSETLKETYGGSGFSVAATGLNAELGRLNTSWTLFAENLYAISEGAMKAVVKGAANILDYFTQLTSNTSSLAASFKSLITTLGGTLLGALSGYAIALAASITGITSFAGALTAGRIAVVGLGTAITNLRTLMATNWITLAAAAVGTLAANFLAAKNAAQDMEDKITETIKKQSAYQTPESKYRYDIENNPVVKDLDQQIKYQEKTIEELKSQAAKLSGAKGIAANNAAEELTKVNAQIETKLAELKYLRAAYATEWAAIINGPAIDKPLTSTTDITSELSKVQEDTFKVLGEKQQSAAMAYLRQNAKLMESLRKAMSEEGNKQAEEARKALAQIYSNAEAIKNKEDADKTYSSGIANINRLLVASTKSNKDYLEEIDNQYAANLKSIREYYAEKANIIAKSTESETSLARERIRQTQEAGRPEEEIAAVQMQYEAIIEERKKLTEKFNQDRTEAERLYAKIAKESGFDILGMTKKQADGIAALRDEYDKLILSARQYYEKSLRNSGLKESEIQISMQEFDRTEVARVQNTAQEERNSRLKSYISSLRTAKEEMTSLNDISQSLFSSQAEGVGKLVGAFQNLTVSMRENNALLKENSDMAAVNDQAKQNGIIGYTSWLHNKYDIEQKGAKLAEKSTADQISGMAQLAGAAASMFSKKSAAAKALHAIEMGLAVARMAMQAKEMAQSVLKIAVDVAAGAAKMFSQSGWLGFAGVAAMLAVMATLGFQGKGGMSGSYIPDSADSGTVLGDKSAKSESAKNTYDLLKEIHAKEYRELRTIADAVQGLNSGIMAFVTQWARAGGNIKNIALPKSMGQSLMGMSPIPKIMQKDNVLLDWANGSALLKGFTKLVDLLMGTPKIVAQGILIQKQFLQGLSGGLSIRANSFADIEQKGIFSSSKKTVIGPLSELLLTSLTKIFNSAAITMRSLANSFGDSLDDAVSRYIIPRIKIKLGKNGQKNAEKLQNTISTALDKMADTIFGPELKRFQSLGEGMYETVVRVASQNALVNKLFASIKASSIVDKKLLTEFSDALINLVEPTGTASEKVKEFAKVVADFYTALTPESLQLLDSFGNLAENLAFSFTKLDKSTAENLKTSFFSGISSFKDFGLAVENFIKNLGTSNIAVTAEFLRMTDLLGKWAKEFRDIIKPTIDQITTWQDTLDTRTNEQLTAALLNSRDINEQKHLVSLLQKKVVETYNTQINAVKSLKTSFINLAETVKRLLLGDLSTLDPKQKLDEAQKQYNELLIASKSNDAVAAAEAAGKLGSAAENYLKEAKSYYGSTATYAAIFSSVTKTLSDLSISAQNSDVEITLKITELTTAAITQLNDLASNFSTAFANYLKDLAEKKTKELPETKPVTSLETLFLELAKAKLTKDKGDDKSIQRLIKAYNLGGDAFLTAVKGDSLGLKAYKEVIATQLALDEAELVNTKDLLRKAKTLGLTKLQIDELIAKKNELTTKIANETAIVKFKANGGTTSGLTLVGERGPELLNLPAGTNVINNTNTQRMLSANDKAELEYLAGIKTELVRLNDRMELIERKTRLGAKA